MNTNDYVKYITQTFVKYIDQPKDERKRRRMEKKDMQASLLFRWFGIIPFIILGQLRKKK